MDLPTGPFANMYYHGRGQRNPKHAEDDSAAFERAINNIREARKVLKQSNDAAEKREKK